jgi:hypothetical protein
LLFLQYEILREFFLASFEDFCGVRINWAFVSMILAGGKEGKEGQEGR